MPVLDHKLESYIHEGVVLVLGLVAVLSIDTFPREYYKTFLQIR